MANDTVSYDHMAIVAAQKDADDQADATRDYRNTGGEAEAAFEDVQADVGMDELIGTLSAEDGSTQLIAAADTMSDAQLGASVTWADAVAGDDQTEIGTVGNAKVDWVQDVTDHEAGYLAEAATLQATETRGDALAAAGMDGTFADEESAFEVLLAGYDDQQTHTDEGDEQALVHEQAEADAGDEVAYAQAGSDYETTLWNTYAAQLASAAAAAASSDPATAALTQYYATVAFYEAGEVATDGTACATAKNCRWRSRTKFCRILLRLWNSKE